MTAMTEELPPLPGSPLVSVLIPNYNHAKFVADAVRSALDQSWKQVEVLVCDDGSTDNSRAVLSPFKSDPRFKLICKENGGQASAVNTAFAESRGEIIALLDADDLFYPDKIQRVIDRFRQNLKAGLLIHRLDKTDGRGGEFGQLPMVASLPAGWFREQVITAGSSPHGFPVTSGIVLRREIATRIFPVSEAVVYDLDEMVRRLGLLISPVTGIEDALGAYRIHGENVTALDVADRLEKMLPIYRVMAMETRRFVERELPAELKRIPPPEEDLNLLLMRYVLIRLNRAPEDEEEASVQSLWERIRRSSGFRSWSVVRRGFWQATVRMPPPLFRRAVALYWNSNGHKLQLTRLKKRLGL